MSKRGFIFVIVFFVSMFALSFVSAGFFSNVYEGMTGHVVGPVNVPRCQTVLSCADDEGSTDFFKFGTVTYKKNLLTQPKVVSDSCVGVSSNLKEYYCENNKRFCYQLTNCPNGCSNGVCKQEEQDLEGVGCVSSSETDHGRNGFVKGEITLSDGTSVEDECKNTIILTEYFCPKIGVNKNKLQIAQITCVYGCLDGVCKKQQNQDSTPDTSNTDSSGINTGNSDENNNAGTTGTDQTSALCVDSDKGDFPLVFGDVVYKGGDAKADICSGTDTLLEGVCQGDVYSVITHSCSKDYSGGVCLDGKCVEFSNADNGDGSNSDTGSNMGNTDEDDTGIDTGGTGTNPEEDQGLYCNSLSANGPLIEPTTRVYIDGVLYYCDPLTLDYVKVLANGVLCTGDYMCESNVCVDTKCTSISEVLSKQNSLITKIWCVITNPISYPTGGNCVDSTTGIFNSNNDYCKCLSNNQ